MCILDGLAYTDFVQGPTFIGMSKIISKVDKNYRFGVGEADSGPVGRLDP